MVEKIGILGYIEKIKVWYAGIISKWNLIDIDDRQWQEIKTYDITDLKGQFRVNEYCNIWNRKILNIMVSV